MTAPIWAVVAGGGTAGHVFPGIAIGRALVAAGHPPESIHFVGSRRGVDSDLVPAAGFDLTVLPGRGIRRRLTFDNVAAITGLARGLWQAHRLLGRLRPRVVISLGGYASVPCAVAALLRRIPVVVAEQNAVPGAANRLVARWARACAVSFAGTDLPRSVLTGNPVREEILAVDRSAGRAAARTRLEVPVDRHLIVVFGGSLGARRVNRATVDACRILAGRGDLAVRHIVGDRDWEEVAESVVDEGALTRRLVRFENDMASVFAAADLVVCRAGATSVAELTVTGTPSVLVPLPGAPGDHQSANARAVERTGGAVVVPDEELDGPRLAELITTLLGDPDRLATMGAAAASMAHRDAAAAVARLAEEYARA
ncbi:MAG: undecaprenyldiphospho-muramoylpentapeptide beta-N-acetylglucosaminyltransferase [Acidimicrobiales bacterium]